jgi:hypothetical protein
MARKLRIQFAGAIYHVTFRGNARQAIFADDRDRERLTARVAESTEDFGVCVYLYCYTPLEERLRRLREYRWSSESRIPALAPYLGSPGMDQTSATRRRGGGGSR